MKKHYLLAVVATVVLSACSGQQETNLAELETAQEQEGALETDAATPPANRPEVNLPANIQLPFAYSVVYDRDYEVKGKIQKRILVEFTEGDTAQIDKQVAELLNQAGYRRAKPHNEDGGIRVNYSNGEGLRITTLIRPAGESVKLKNPDAKGNLYIAWIP